MDNREFCACNKPCGLDDTNSCTNFRYICEEGKPACLNDIENDGNGDNNVNQDDICEDPNEVPMCSNGKLASKVCKNFGKSTANCEPVFYQGQLQCGRLVQKVPGIDVCSLLTNPLILKPSPKNCPCEFTCKKGKPMCKNQVCKPGEQPWCKDYRNGRLISYGVKAMKNCRCTERFTDIFYLEDYSFFILLMFVIILGFIIIVKK